jgi:hypothetical protein
MIEILGHKQLARKYPNGCENLIFISDPEAPYFYPETREVVDKSKNKLVLLFTDAEEEEEGFMVVLPTRAQIEQAINFAKGKENLVVSCSAGISRSAATALVIAVQRNGLDKGFSILDPELHWPNLLVVRHGADIIGQPDLVRQATAWKKSKISSDTDIF